ncbi:hypothetical protein HDE_04429 [Halotydeus destructor]|nr:hypothetical protein HDE_04429 [Halotydeus destructor]
MATARRLTVFISLVIFTLVTWSTVAQDTADCESKFKLVGTRCVHVCMEKKRSLYETKVYCKSKGAMLVKVQDEGDNESLRKLVGENNWAWLGANVTFSEDKDGAFSPAVVFHDGTSDFKKSYSPKSCNWNGCCIKMSGSRDSEFDWFAADCRQRTAYSMCEKATQDGDEGKNSSSSSESEEHTKMADLKEGQSSEEEEEEETYSPEECLVKMRGDIHDMVSLIEKIKMADPSIRFVVDDGYVIVTNASNETISKIIN